MKKPCKVLCLFDFYAKTGFGTVTENIVNQLTKHFGADLKLDIVGVNYFGEPFYYNEHTFVLPVKPEEIKEDDFGRFFFLKALQDSDEYDGIFICQDLGIIVPIIEHLEFIKTEKKDQNKKQFKSMFYFPVDCRLPYELTRKLEFFDCLVTYTEFGRNDVLRLRPELKGKLKVINHGNNSKDFYPLPEDESLSFRKEYFGENADKCIIINVNRNQPRKDIPNTIFGFIEAKEIWRNDLPEPFLYLHCHPADPLGHDLKGVLRQTELVENKDYQLLPEKYWDEMVDKPMLNKIYNAADIFLSTTLGEGWGLCLHPETMILTKSGYKQINNIDVGDLVLTRHGYKSVLNKSVRHVKEKVSCIVVNGRSSNQPLILTKEHRVLTNKGWKKAGDIIKGDAIEYINDKPRDYKKLSLSKTRLDMYEYCKKAKICMTETKIWIHGSKNKHRLSRYINVNKNFCELYGIYLAEGSARKRGIVFSVNKNESELTKRIIFLIKDVFGKDISVAVESGVDNNKRWIIVYSLLLQEFFKNICGRGAKNKHIKLLERLTNHGCSKVIKGFWLGDGSVDKSGYTMTTCSKQLAYDLIQLGDKIKLNLSFTYNPKRDSYKIYTPAYVVQFFARIVNDKSFGHIYRYGNIRVNKDYRNVVSVNEQYFDETFCDLSIEEAHEFMTAFGLVHNSFSEAAATQKPIVAPYSTSFMEMSGYGKNAFMLQTLYPFCGVTDNIIREQTDIYEIADTLLKVAKMKYGEDHGDMKERIERNYNWVKGLEWSRVCELWIKYFRETF